MFKGKVAVITGAGSGIGRALAKRLAAEGARLALSDVNAGGLAETVCQLPAGTESRRYKLDVSSRAAFFAHADEVLRDFGSVDFVFNNAGTTLIGTFSHLSIEEIEWQLGINLWGVVYGTKAFLPAMLERKQGCIVNMSSVFGLLGFPMQSAYNISKFGVRGLTECLWSELEGTGVNAVCVHPGGIKTGFEKAARICAAADEQEEKFVGLAEKLLKTSPEQCADDILNGIRRGHRRIITGNKSSTLFWLSRWFPNTYPRLIKLLAK